MTSYITITDAETDPEAPLTSELAKKWRDNPLAIVEGDVTAPKIFGEAMARPFIGLPTLVVTGADTYVVELGLTVVPGTLINGTSTNVVAMTYTVNAYTGTLRFKASHRDNNSSGTYSSIIELYKNNVLAATFTTQSDVAVARAADVSVVPTDVLQWRHRTTTLGESVMSNFFVTASNTYVDQPVYKRATSP